MTSVYKPITKIAGIISILIIGYFKIDFNKIVNAILEVSKLKLKGNTGGDVSEYYVTKMDLNNILAQMDTFSGILSTAIAGFLFLAVLWCCFKLLLELSNSIEELDEAVRDHIKMNKMLKYEFEVLKQNFLKNYNNETERIVKNEMH